MRMEPVLSYVCEYCGKKFPNSYECDSHEKYCKYESRAKICDRCNGKGYFTLDLGGLPGHNGYDRYRECFCSDCNGRGKIYK